MGCDIAQHIASAGKKATIASRYGWKNRRNCWVFYPELFELLGKLTLIEPELDIERLPTMESSPWIKTVISDSISADTVVIANGFKVE